MDRLYQDIFDKHLAQHRQMVFVMGPRQAGKTTAVQRMVAEHEHAHYFNWDNVHDREHIVTGPAAIAEMVDLKRLSARPPLIVFDEIHKFKDWRGFLKGLYDSYPDQTRIMVTGSAKLDVFSRGGDSLMGRYFPFRFHPLSVAELAQQGVKHDHEYWDVPRALSGDQFEALWRFGPYPDPFFKQSEAFSLRWKTLRRKQLFNEDVRDLTRIQDIDHLELLAELLKGQVGSLTSYHSLGKRLRVSDNTVRNWLVTLRALYYCFAIRPWSRNVARAVLKEPKYYLWDWSLCTDEGARAENMVAQHLLKATHCWNDLGLGDYGLHFVRDKEKREVDFLVTKDQEPWMLVEVKLSHNKGISSSLRYFTEALKPQFSFQVVLKMDFVDKSCFAQPGIWVVPAKTFLSQLV